MKAIEDIYTFNVIGDAIMMKSCKIKTYLANLAVWNVKLHNIHWNVVGPYFVSVHEYTEKLYDEVFEAYDAVAELLKMRGKTPLSTMKAYLDRATLEEVEPRAFDCCEAVAMVEADMQKMLDLAVEIRNEAAEADDYAVQGMFEGYIAGFTKELWFLRAMQSKTVECGCGGEGCCCQKK